MHSMKATIPNSSDLFKLKLLHNVIKHAKYCVQDINQLLRRDCTGQSGKAYIEVSYHNNQVILALIPTISTNMTVTSE